LEAENLEAFADRGYFKGEEIHACEQAGITVTLPKPQTSEAKSEGRFGKQDFRYVAEEDIYICPAGEKLAHHFTNEENGLVLRRYWTNACRTCALKAQCTKGPQRRITRWEHEYVVDAAQARLDKNPDAMRTRRETVEHPFGTLKMRMGADALSDEDAAQGGDRDGVARARLQPHARDEHPRYQTARRGDPGVRSVYRCARRVTVQVAQRGPRLRPD
jgi:hypothetical protein